jgi:hypothetical protein
MPDSRPTNDLSLIAQLHCGHRVDTTGQFMPLDASVLKSSWETLKASYAELYSTSARDDVGWHRAEAQACEDLAEWTAAIWHLDRLIEADPRSTSLRTRRSRAQAERFAEQFAEDANRLNTASWEVVREPNAHPAAYPLALSRAEAACRINPNSGRFLNTLGVAQYRVGRFHEALETLSRSEKLNRGDLVGRGPSDIAFQAMTQHKLGQAEASRASLRVRNELTVITRRHCL